MNKITIQYSSTSFGELILGSFGNKLCLCDWRYRKMRSAIDDRLQKQLQAGFIEGDSSVLTETRQQLAQYFNGQRKQFTIPLLMVGTDFQKSVWNELLNVGYGRTSSYLELAKRIGKSKAVRAVASANGANAISIIVPCHRIIGSTGDLVGYAGGLRIKKKLLELENALLPAAV
ncbi:MAG: methylated-DNA--[protein]-cysteine S-methyltransferase [Desulfobacterales bacterium]|nr:methylated-DNA--[protein]-cysteine S-methyltransferase [Deltaproteobacteria bacterium]NNK94430.1 methylated-DNA--[protein]-cysteine S-methyltransferase [Desulfobacterales bacterium]